MANIMQQSRRYQGVSGAFLLGKARGLQHVRRLRDRLSQVLARAFAREQISD
jgi:hypothetical protein